MSAGRAGVPYLLLGIALLATVTATYYRVAEPGSTWDGMVLLLVIAAAVSGTLFFVIRSRPGARAIALRAVADRQRADEAMRTLQAGLEGLAGVSRQFSAVQTLDSLLSKIAETCGSLLASDSVGFRLVEGDELVARGLWGDAKDFMPTRRIKIGQSLSGLVAASGEPLVVSNLADDPRLISEHREPVLRLGARGWLGVPVKVGDRVIGVFSIRTRRPEGFAASDVAIATAFASQAAGAIQNAGLFAEVRQRAAEVETLAAVNETLASTLDLDRVLEGILDGALRIVGAERAVVYSLDEAGATLRALAVRGSGTSLGNPVKVGHAVVGSAVERRAPVACDDVLTTLLPGADEFYEDHGSTLGEAIRRQDFRGILAAPLMAGEAVLGAICVYWRGIHEASEQEIRLLTALARQAAVALDKSRLYMEATEQARQMKALADIGRTLSETLALDIVGERISESIRSLVSVKRATVYRLDPQTGDLTAVAKEVDSYGLGRHVPAGTAVIGRAVEERALVSSPDALHDPRIRLTEPQRERMAATDHRAVMALPLIVQDRIIGALTLGDHVGRVFGEAEARLARAFADQAAIALENARLYEEAQQRLRRMETLLAVGRTVGTTLDLVESTRRVAREMALALGADMIGAYLCGPDGSMLEPLAGYRVPANLLEDFRRFPIAAAGHRFVEEAWQTRGAVWSSNVESDPRVDRVMLARFPHRAMLFAPMILDGAPIGGLFAVWWQRSHDFSPDELRLAEGIAHQAAIAVANGRLFAREREARAASERTEHNRRLLFANAPLPMWVFDEQTLGFLEINEAAVAHYGYARDEFLQMRISDIRPPEDLPRLHESIAMQVDGVRAAGEWRHRRKDGGLIDVEVVSHSLEFAGRPARLVVINDITERKRAEAALGESEEQVRQLQKLEAVGRLAGGIAHDFNNLLTVIQSRTTMLLSHMSPQERARRNVEIIEKTAKRAALLTAQLLAFSRKQILQPKVLDVNAVVSNVEDILRWLIGEDIDLIFQPAAELGRVRADPGQLEQVIMNLVVNARDAMPQGGRLTLDTSNVELDAAYAARHAGVRAGRYVMLGVSDTGIGMDAATQARIFEPFFTTKGPDKGTGLGLATAYGIVRQSGGHIGFYSEPGLGTSFKIYLPHVDAAGESLEPLDPQARPPEGTETVVLVEDDAEVQALTREVLEELGYTVLTARRPGDAIQLVQRYEGVIHLLLTDVVMPHMSGRRLAEHLVSLRPDLKVLYMSGYTDDAISHHGVLDPGIPFLQKPFTPDGLARKIREVLDGSVLAS